MSFDTGMGYTELEVEFHDVNWTQLAFFRLGVDLCQKSHRVRDLSVAPGFRCRFFRSMEIHKQNLKICLSYCVIIAGHGS